jgi:hypothetical protein
MEFPASDDETSAGACWRRFSEAAEAARAGHYALGHALIRRVRERFGDYAAECARRELAAFAKTPPDALGRANGGARELERMRAAIAQGAQHAPPRTRET